MTSVLFSFRREAIGEGNNLPGREQLFEKLRSMALDPIVSLNAETAYGPEGIAVAELVGDIETAPTGVRPLKDMSLIVNRIGRSFNFSNMPEGTEQDMPPVLNENAMRSLAFRKHRVWAEVFEPLSMGIATQLISSETDIPNFLDTQSATDYIIKPDNGTDGKRVVSHSADALKKAGIVPADSTLIIQPRYNFSHGFPAGLRAYDQQSQEAFDGWSKSDALKELRVYGFHSPVSTEVFPVGRALKDGIDHWFFVDPESVPRPVLESSRLAVAKSAEVSGSPAVLATVDSGYGSLQTEDPDFHAIELNGKAPYVIGYDKHAGVADKLRDMLSKQIKDTVESGRVRA